MANEEHLTILRQGALVWNAWREKHPEAKIDLSGADLAQTHLEHANLSYACLDGANLCEAHLECANLAYASLQGANLAYACLTQANLSCAQLKKATLAFGCLDRAVLLFAGLQGADLRAASLHQVSAEDADFQGADLSHAHLEQSILASSSFRKATLADACLFGANLSRVSLRNANISSVRFDQKVLWKTLWEVRLHPVALWKRRLDLLLDTTMRTKGIDADSCYGSQRFKIFLKDQDFLEECLETRWGKFLCWIWWIFADCGRSLSRWAGWSLLFVFLFAWIYWSLGPESFNMSQLKFNFWSLFYYSVVSFTTLGFGDITPKTEIVAMLVSVEVVVGYVMLGGLISIFSKLLARRG